MAINDLKETMVNLQDPKQLKDLREKEDFRPGMNLGPGNEHYQFIDDLGKGNMGKVYLFKETYGDYLVAVKTLIGKDEKTKLVKSLQTEYTNMFRLTHPNIVAVRNLVADEFRYYLVMDYVEGETLEDCLDQLKEQHQKPSLSVTLEVMKGLAGALDFAHSMGIIHRDVKPANVMVRIDGGQVETVKLTDFGLSVETEELLMMSTNSRGGGTKCYMAPEQHDPHFGDLSGKTDQYALAAVAYEMLSGDYPYREYALSGGGKSLRGAVLDENKYPKRIDGLPDNMNAALRKALSKWPKDRFENCMAFVNALKQRPVIVAPPAPQPKQTVVTPPPQPVIVTPPAPQPKQTVVTPPPQPVIVTPPPLVVKKPSSDPLPEKETMTLILPGNVPLELVHIRAGSFMMGRAKDVSGYEKQHHVTLTKDFWLGKYEVTQGQWLALMGSNPSYFKKGDRYPVEQVNWEDAMDFCRKLTKQERSAGRLTTGYEYTLPTEAQWEYACRAGTTTPFSFGLTLNGDKANCEALLPLPPYGGIYLGCTSEVGSYAPNAWGLYDMHGNVCEWCRDWYEYGYAKDPEFLRGNARSSRVLQFLHGDTALGRVSRGGSWNDPTIWCDSARRCFPDPTIRNCTQGFRVALAPVQ